MNPPIYELKQVQHYYNDHKALEIDHLKIKPGERVGIIGPNGSGKSTLLKLLAGVETPSQGNIFLNDKPLYPFMPSARSCICMMPQTAALLNRTVAENVAFGLNLRKRYKNQNHLIHEALESVGLPSKQFIHRRNHALSGGESRRVALAARLVLETSVLILDEPTAGIDIESAIRIQEAILKNILKKNTTLIVSSHDHEWLSRVCQRQLFFFHGKHRGTDRKNIVFGPFEMVSSEKWVKSGTLIYVTKPPLTDAIALIDPDDIHIYTKKPAIQSHEAMVYGQIIHLGFRPHCLSISVSIMIDSFHLLAVVKNRDIALRPGQMVYAVYDLAYVQWSVSNE